MNTYTYTYIATHTYIWFCLVFSFHLFVVFSHQQLWGSELTRSIRLYTDYVILEGSPIACSILPGIMMLQLSHAHSVVNIWSFSQSLVPVFLCHSISDLTLYKPISLWFSKSLPVEQNWWESVSAQPSRYLINLCFLEISSN